MVRNTNTATRLLAWLQRIFGWFGNFQILHQSAPALYWLIVLGLLAVFAALVAHIVWMVSVALRAPEPPEPSMSRENPRDLATEAESLAASGRYLEAAHGLMIASFRALAERSVIDLRPDRSNRWIRGAVRSSKLDENLAGEIDSLVERTERHWFGDRQNNPAIYAQWRSAFAHLSDAAR
ncbi:MAG TPA: hypothetical protein VJX23_17140 [Candidatus Binataceae bacterium]|nr:hypothetical protein [Candidatus Binataceae bacterium]